MERYRPLLKRHWPVVAAVAIYLGVTAVVLVLSMRLNEGHLVYLLDDAYVHMAIAKNVALHHVWGVTPFAFSSSTSSPLWTLMLALTYMVLGVGAVAPLVFNVVAGTLVVVTIDRFMRARSAHAPLVFAVLVATIFIAPLPALTFSGMEHTLHALATLWFVFAAASLLASKRPVVGRELAVLALLGAFTAGLRYEGLFTVVVVALLLALTRRLTAAAVVTVMGAFPIVVSGLWSVYHEWYFLPNSVLLKGQTPSLDAGGVLRFVAGAPALHNLIANPHLLLMVVAALTALLLIASAPIWDGDAFLLTILVGTTLLHLQLARVGWFYRYEAYLIVLGAAVFGVIAAGRVRQARAWTSGVGRFARMAVAMVLIAVAGFPFASRGLNSLRNIPLATSNIYQQQYQMGVFLQRFYDGQWVALNDIGAVSYLAEVRLLDLYGLASVDVARLKLAGRYGSGEIGELANHRAVAVAVAYPSWLSEYGGVPAGWTKVGEWGVRDNIVLGENAVSFYAARDDERPRLVENLRTFAPLLPVAVLQEGEYTR